MCSSILAEWEHRSGGFPSKGKTEEEKGSGYFFGEAPNQKLENDASNQVRRHGLRDRRERGKR